MDIEQLVWWDPTGTWEVGIWSQDGFWISYIQQTPSRTLHQYYMSVCSHLCPSCLLDASTDQSHFVSSSGFYFFKFVYNFIKVCTAYSVARMSHNTLWVCSWDYLKSFPYLQVLSNDCSCYKAIFSATTDGCFTVHEWCVIYCWHDVSQMSRNVYHITEDG